ncbi:hypothetical protein FGO68_gene15235 [Halteria grandinella]|uniref:FZ domain-containing protein n=1 Tax=Halteria grandinella TaxID=5974 RepID=A0A8J8T7J9_HALGN|nr:hypothetical protein FGO68_gene15235 [Halteria grandinella]
MPLMLILLKLQIKTMSKIYKLSLLGLALSLNYLLVHGTDNTTTGGTTKPVTILEDDELPPQWQSCWNVELDDETLFCYGAVHWPITYELYKNAGDYDAKAKSDYKQLLSKWRETQLNTQLTDPSNDCLAISRDFYCAYYFPKCADDQNQATPMCDYLCAIWLLRCPLESQSYCVVQSSEKTCSLSIQNGWRGYLTLFFMLLLIAFTLY